MKEEHFLNCVGKQHKLVFVNCKKEKGEKKMNNSLAVETIFKGYEGDVYLFPSTYLFVHFPFHISFQQNTVKTTTREKKCSN